VFGAIGSALFIDSTPPEKDSPEAKAEKLKSELTRAQSRIALLETQVPKKEGSLADHTRAGAARILDDLKHGR
jgi:peptidoglycan hydrolase CwlO-like protein